MNRRLERGSELLLATHNDGKVRELRELLAPHDITVRSSAELGLDEPEETGETFADNARIKACAACGASGLVTLADDSGLEVHALGGAPGIRSARWAGPERDFALAMRRVVDGLEDRYGSMAEADRSACFRAVLCLRWPDGAERIFEGVVDGEIVDPPRGTGGFGYDPIFIPRGERSTFAQMPSAAKSELSHRARALQLLLQECC